MEIDNNRIGLNYLCMNSDGDVAASKKTGRALPIYSLYPAIVYCQQSSLASLVCETVISR